MSTLEELNTYSDGVIVYTDNRPSNVIFNYPAPYDLTDNSITTTSFTLERTIDIIEIVKPADALVQFEIDISAAAGTTISWSSIPSGVSVALVNNVYIVNGIDSVSDWDAMKAPTITIPASTQGGFTYTCKITYTNDGVRKSKQWEVGNFKSISSLTATSSLSLSPQVIYGFYNQFITSSFTLDIGAQLTAILSFGDSFALDCTGIKVHLGNANPTSTASISCQLSGIQRIQAGLTSVVYVDADVDKIDALTGFTNKSFRRFEQKQLFSDGNSYIGATNNTDSDWKLVLYSPDGYFGDDITGNGFEITGTVANINTTLQSTFFGADYNQTSSTSYTVSLYKNNVLFDSNFRLLTYEGLATFTDTLKTINYGTVHKFSLEEYLYGQLEYLVVGGGGAGAAGSNDGNDGGQFAGGGGASGQVQSGSAQTIETLYLNVTVGRGGSVASNVNDGNDGGDSSIAFTGTGATFSTTAVGGTGGGTGYTTGGDGGDNNRTGGSGARVANVARIGGGGAGSTTAGNSGTYDGTFYYGGEGGDPTTSSISGTAVKYACGGSGGVGSTQFIFSGGYPNNRPVKINPDYVDGNYGNGGHGGGGNGQYSGTYYIAPDAGEDGVVILKVTRR